MKGNIILYVTSIVVMGNYHLTGIFGLVCMFEQISWGWGRHGSFVCIHRYDWINYSRIACMCIERL